MVQRQNRGFTLIEVLVVVAILAVLAAILFPVITKAREKANQTKCLTNQKQLSLAINSWVVDHGEKFPTENFWQSLEAPHDIVKCPSEPNSPIGYVFNGTLLNRPLAAVKESMYTMLIADGTHDATTAPATELNVAYGPADIAFRHQNSVIMTFVDGHQIITRDTRDLPIEFRPAPAAEFVDTDTSTMGDYWKSTRNTYTYGSRGYVLCAWDNAANGAVTALNGSFISAVTPAGATNVTWEAAPSSDPRALVDPVTSSRSIGCWQNDGSYTVTLTDPADNEIHSLRLYCVDFEREKRSQTIDIMGIDGKSLLKQPVRLREFSEGAWVGFRFRGKITIKLQNFGGTNAVVSAFAFD